MRYTHLGRSGLTVSRLCLGTMNFGPQTEETQAFAILDTAQAAGINFVDTANVYGGSSHRGWTEEILGRWFAQGGERRERTVLATKLFGTMTDRPNESKLSALHIRRALDASLKRLQTDYIDLYQFHHVDRNTPWEEIWQAIEVAVQQGKILYAGSSNFAGWHIARAQETAARRNYNGLVSEQSIYNLLTRDVELEVIPAAQQYGLGILPWSPLHGGLLGGVLKKEGDGVRRIAGRAARSAQVAPETDPALRGLRRRTGPGPGGRGARVAAPPAGSHRPDHRPAHPGAARSRRQGAQIEARRRRTQAPRRDLPGPPHGTGRLRLVAGPRLRIQLNTPYTA